MVGKDMKYKGLSLIKINVYQNSTIERKKVPTLLDPFHSLNLNPSFSFPRKSHLLMRPQC